MLYSKFQSTFIILIILMMLPFLSQTITASADFNISEQIINPDSFYYPLKRIKEKIMVHLHIDSSSRADYYKDLVQNRMAELNYVVDKDYLDQVERSSQRVSYQVGILTDFVVEKKLNNKKKVLTDLYRKDKDLLEKLRDKYPANSSFWMLVQHTINSIDLNLQKL